ncbi:MAG: LysR family transcriptional regulator [Betaproteobacteria bacterium]|jgi:DNA-binding transcriptional LysR family regulator
MQELNFSGFVNLGLKPKQLQLIVALDELRNISKVANYVRITQPAVSKSLNELEIDLGVKLFDRSSRGIAPTIYGECLVQYAKKILIEFTNLRNELRSLKSGAFGSIKIGALTATAPSILPQSLRLLKETSPLINVLIKEGLMETLLPELWSNKLDLIIGRLAPSNETEGLASINLSYDSSLIVCGPKNKLANRKKTTWSDLEGLPWILPPSGTLLREPLEQAFKAHKLTFPNNTIETLSIQISTAYVQCSDALAVLPSSSALYYQNLGLIKVLPIELFEYHRPIGILWNAKKSLTPSAKLLVECLESLVDKNQIPS